MPKPISFGENSHDYEPSSTTWIVGRKGFLSLLYAFRGKREIQIEQLLKPTRLLAWVPVVSGRVARVKIHSESLQLEFEIFTSDSTSFEIRPPEVGSIRLIGPRVEVTLTGIGRALNRNAWRDVHTSKNIMGFIDAQCERPECEEDLVWLAAALGRSLIEGTN